MIQEEVKNNKKYFVCEECKLKYKEKRWAERCQKWCKEYNSCNIEITKHAIKLPLVIARYRPVELKIKK